MIFVFYRPPPTTLVASVDTGLAGSIDRRGQHLGVQQQQKNRLQAEGPAAGAPSVESLTITNQQQRTALGPTYHACGTPVCADPSFPSPLNQMDVDEVRT